MSEVEVPLEQTLQDIEHAAHGAAQSWITWSALLSALFAVMAAVSALHAGHEVNEAMLQQMKASDTWAFYQAKGIKAHLAESRVELLTALAKPVPETLPSKIAQYEQEQKELQKTARENGEASEAHLRRHEIFAKAVTFFQIAIAVTAIAVLSRRRHFLYASAGFGLVGLFFLGNAFLTKI